MNDVPVCKSVTDHHEMLLSARQSSHRKSPAHADTPFFWEPSTDTCRTHAAAIVTKGSMVLNISHNYLYSLSVQMYMLVLLKTLKRVKCVSFDKELYSFAL